MPEFAENRTVHCPIRSAGENSPRAEGDRSLRQGDRGFVLLFVLLVIAVLSAGALLLSARSIGMINIVRAETEAGRERVLLGAAIARAIRALQFPDDPLELIAASRDRPALWRYDGKAVSIFIEREGEKFDVNEGDLRHLPRFLSILPLSDTSRQAVADAIGRYRTERRTVPGLAALLPDCERLGNGAARLSRAMTVVSRQQNPTAPLPVTTADGADRAVAAATDGSGDNGTSPLVTIVAMTDMLEERVLVQLLARPPYVETVQTILTNPNSIDVCLD